MKRKMLEAAAAVIAADLLDVERKCDASIGALARMALEISTVREPAGLPIHYGQDALDHLAKTLVAFTAARREAGDLHTVLGAENESLGNPAKLFGDGKPVLSSATGEPARADLRRAA
jgi:hypothetical protein